MLKPIISLARPYQWAKNLFIFLPAFFAFKINNPVLLWQGFIAFAAFSLTASAVYVLNDWKDREEDRNHPVKRLRPIASGEVRGAAAFALLAALLTGGAALSLFSSVQVFFFVAVYFLLNMAYSFRFKHVPIIDIVLISTGFVLRLFVGAKAMDVQLSHWIIVMTFLLALFLALAKRRDDMLIFLATDRKTRRVIDGYNLKFLDSAMVMTASIVVLAYILWSLSPDVSARLSTDYAFVTALFVLLGVLRYMQITFVEQQSGSPTRVLLRDRFIQLSLAGWAGSFLFLLYFW